jgi:transposase
MDFPITDLMDQQACYDFLTSALHPHGLTCPRCNGTNYRIHRSHRDPVFDYRCNDCRRVFNAWTGTAFQGTHKTPAQLVLLCRGLWQGESTARLARELGCHRPHLLTVRHRLQELAQNLIPKDVLPDAQTEADEMFQNAGEKGVPHTDPDDPPRTRANKRRGLGTFANDRPPIGGVVGRDSKRLHMEVLSNANKANTERLVGGATRQQTIVYTDESTAYQWVRDSGRGHATVCHSAGEFARDDDGDGIREVPNNTSEGIWTGLRNFLRRFRGVSKWYLGQYVAMFQWGYLCKTVFGDCIRALCGLPPATNFQT